MPVYTVYIYKNYSYNANLLICDSFVDCTKGSISFVDLAKEGTFQNSFSITQPPKFSVQHVGGQLIEVSP